MNTGMLLIVGAAIIFSCAGLFVKLAAVSPEVLVGWRTVIPVLVVAALNPSLIRRVCATPSLILLGVSCLSALRVTVWVEGMLRTPMSKAVIVLYTWPLMFTVLGWMFLGERVTLRTASLLLVGFCGVLLMGGDGPIDLNRQEQVGLLLMLCVAVLNAANYTLFKSQLRKHNPDEVLLYDNLVGAMLFLPFLASRLDATPLSSIPWLVCYGGLLGCCGYYLMYAGLKRVQASTAAVLSYVEVLFAGALGVVVFSEPITVRMMISALMILVPAALVRRRG